MPDKGAIANLRRIIKALDEVLDLTQDDVKTLKGCNGEGIDALEQNTRRARMAANNLLREQGDHTMTPLGPDLTMTRRRPQ